MSDLVGNPEDRFSHNEAHLFLFVNYLLVSHQSTFSPSTFDVLFTVDKFTINVQYFTKKSRCMPEQVYSIKVLRLITANALPAINKDG